LRNMHAAEDKRRTGQGMEGNHRSKWVSSSQTGGHPEDCPTAQRLR
jgi:hypothetical protein